MRIIWKILKWIIGGILGGIALVVLLLFLDQDYLAQPPEAQDTYPVHDHYALPQDSSVYFQLYEQFGRNKNLPKGYEYASLFALQHYPELAEVPIDFVLEEAMIPLGSRPAPLSILFPWQARRYLVVISTKSIPFFDPILMDQLPFDEQVGVLGHELGHTLYYLDKRAIDMAGIAYSYLNDSDFQYYFERDTDKRGIAHGLGPQLFRYAVFVRKELRGIAEEDLPRIFDLQEGDYLTPKEILEEMEGYPMYQDWLIQHKDSILARYQPSLEGQER